MFDDYHLDANNTILDIGDTIMYIDGEESHCYGVIIDMFEDNRIEVATDYGVLNINADSTYFVQ